MSNFYVGTQKPKSMYVGTNKCKSVYLGTTKVWSSKPPWLCFTALSSGTITLVKEGNPPYWTVTLQYSRDQETWQSYSIGTALSVNVGDSIWFKGDNSGFSFDNSNYFSFVLTADCNCSGNVLSLVDSNCESYPYIGDGWSISANYIFYNLFGHSDKDPDTHLKSVPDLPLYKIGTYSYGAMFMNCQGIIDASNIKLPQLALHSCDHMFYGCKNLVTPPSYVGSTEPESVTTWCTHACSNMFNGCSNMIIGPALPIIYVTDNIYEYMFYNCFKLERISSGLPATDLRNSCYSYMFSSNPEDETSENYVLKTLPAIAATSYVSDSYSDPCYSMFSQYFLKQTSYSSAYPHSWTVNNFIPSGEENKIRMFGNNYGDAVSLPVTFYVQNEPTT